MVSKELTIEQLEMVEKFQRFVIRADIPDEPSPLNEQEFNWMIDRFMEEIKETRQAYKDENFAEVIDGLVDLIYYAYGGIVRQGMAPRACFEAVHKANSNKKRGVHDRRPNESGNDAVKPVDWVNPITRLEMLSNVTLKQIERINDIPQIVLEVVDLVKLKSADYNSNMLTKVLSGEIYHKSIHNTFDIDRSSYFPFGGKSYLQMIHTKLERLKSLEDLKERKQTPNFESTKDTIKDMIAYLIFYSKHIEQEINIQKRNSNVK